MAQDLERLAKGAEMKDVQGSRDRAKLESARDAPWVEKYRPKTLEDVAAHKEVLDTSEWRNRMAAAPTLVLRPCLPDALRVPATAVKRLTKENRLPHLLLYGPPGTGKTSTILAIARQMYGSSLHSMTLELNASDERGIGVVRQEIQDFASTKTIFRCAKLPC